MEFSCEELKKWYEGVYKAYQDFIIENDTYINTLDYERGSFLYDDSQMKTYFAEQDFIYKYIFNISDPQYLESIKKIETYTILKEFRTNNTSINRIEALDDTTIMCSTTSGKIQIWDTNNM